MTSSFLFPRLLDVLILYRCFVSPHLKLVAYDRTPAGNWVCCCAECYDGNVLRVTLVATSNAFLLRAALACGRVDVDTRRGALR